MPEADIALHPFPGGLHLDDHKAESNAAPVRDIPVPPELVLPLQQHIGVPAEPLVAVGDNVRKGQLIARAGDYVSANLHAPTSGTVTAIGTHAIAHPSGLDATCITIAADGADIWSELPEPMQDYAARAPAELRERIRWAGVVGLGGALFPTSVKVNSGGRQQIDTLVINGAECEPYITCDDMLMREGAAGVVAGCAILQHLTGATRCLIGIEDNKPEAIAALRAALHDRADATIRLVEIPTLYPSGGERQLIHLLTGREVPSNNLPASIGVLCQNVATAHAVALAVLEGRPLIERVVTVTGEGIATPGNFRVPLGTPVDFLVRQAGGYTDIAGQLLLGGPMMGFALAHDRLPVTKGGNCFLARRAPEPTPAMPCIRCGECVHVCPARLMPQQLYWHARAKDLDHIQDFNLFDCIECGCCAYVCPSQIPLVQYYRYAKTEIWAQEREREKADIARQRHAARAARLERIERERKARLRKRKEDLEKKPRAKGPDPKKAAIEAAMKRVAARKAAQQAAGDAPAEPPAKAD